MRKKNEKAKQTKKKQIQMKTLYHHKNIQMLNILTDLCFVFFSLSLLRRRNYLSKCHYMLGKNATNDNL